MKVVILGCGKRVLEGALPSLASCDALELEAVYARSERTLEAGGQRVAVRSLENAKPGDLKAAELIYLAVGKNAVPEVLARLLELEAQHAHLLIETPVVRFRHFRHSKLLRSFARVSVAEDCSTLPWFDTIRAAQSAGALGEITRVEFDRSAYAYHAVATARTLLGDGVVKSGRRRKLEAGQAERTLHFAGGSASIVEPRDYSQGRITVHTTSGVCRDHDGDGLRLAPTWSQGRLTGFALGETTTALDDAEAALAPSNLPQDSTATSLHETMKRVGFLRLWRRLAAGDEAYSLAEGLEDMVVDYHLEKFGRYVKNPFTSPNSGLGRSVLSLISRAGG